MIFSMQNMRRANMTQYDLWQSSLQNSYKAKEYIISLRFNKFPDFKRLSFTIKHYFFYSYQLIKNCKIIKYEN